MALVVSNYIRTRTMVLLSDETITRTGERFMGTVMVKCPDTGHDISTGIVADRASFNATPVFFARVYCPVCRAEHEWFAKEAWVHDAESLATPQGRLDANVIEFLASEPV
jgi:hypothetical protein